jgi:hypothetical protein
VVSDWTVNVHLFLVLYARKGWRNIWLTSLRSELPAKDQI